MAEMPKGLTPWEQAAWIVDQTTKAGEKSIQDAIASAEKDRRAALAQHEGVMRAFADMTSGDAATLGASYAGAARGVQGIAQGFTGSLREMQEGTAAQAQANVNAIGAPGGPVESHAPANANVSYFLGGKLPSETLFAEAPLATGAALGRRAAGGMALADQASALDFKAQGGIAELRSKIAELEAKRPGSVMEIWLGIRTANNQERATNVQIGTLQLQQAKTKWDRAEAMTNLTGYVYVVKNGNVVRTNQVATGSDAYTAAQQAETTRLGQDKAAATAARNAALREASDLTKATGSIHVVRGGQVVDTGRRTISQRNWQKEFQAAQAKEDAKRKGGGMTPGQKGTGLNRAHTAGEASIKSKISEIQSGIVAQFGSTKKGKDESTEAYSERRRKMQEAFKTRVSQNYGTFMALVMNAGATQLRQMGYNQAQIKEWARRELAARGIAPRGGRPAGPTGGR